MFGSPLTRWLDVGAALIAVPASLAVFGAGLVFGFLVGDGHRAHIVARAPASTTAPVALPAADADARINTAFAVFTCAPERPRSRNKGK